MPPRAPQLLFVYTVLVMRDVVGAGGTAALEYLRDSIAAELDSGELDPPARTAARRQLMDVMARLGQIPAAGGAPGGGVRGTSVTKSGPAPSSPDRSPDLDEVAERRRIRLAGPR